MSRGESLELVYVFVLLLYRSLHQRGARSNMVAYDTACKLLSRMRAKRDSFPPWTQLLVDDLSL
eukprot:7055004-Karenia_brevis.AAC.1